MFDPRAPFGPVAASLFGVRLRAGVRQVVLAASRERVAGAAARRRVGGAAVDEAGGEARAPHRFFEDARDLLREGAVLARGALLQSLLQLRRHVGADEDAFTISHPSFS